MSSEDVARHQRSRMLHAMTVAAAEVGYGNVTVADVITRASVSRATFYEQFTDKRDCFLAAYDVAASVLLAEADLDEHRTFADLLTIYLDAIADNVDYARVFLVEIGSLGPEGARRRAAGQHRFADVVAVYVDARTTEQRFACEAFVASVAMMMTLRLAVGDVDGVRALYRPLVDLATVLFGAHATGRSEATPIE